jgi:hypothetical protein
MLTKNQARVARARAMLAPYDPETEGYRTAIIDALADLYHLAEREGLSVELCRKTAYMHFAAESAEDLDGRDEVSYAKV